MPCQKRSLNQIGCFLFIFFSLVSIKEAAEPEKSRLASQKKFNIEASLELDFFPSQSSPRFAYSNNLLAYAVVDKYYDRTSQGTGRTRPALGSHIFVRPINGEQLVALTENREYSWSPSWSPDGSKLAYFRCTDERLFLGLWDRASGRKEYFQIADDNVRGNIYWEPEGRTLFFFSQPQEGRVEPYERSENPIIRTTWEDVNPYDRKLELARTTQLQSFDLSRSTFQPTIIKGVNSLSSLFSPDGRFLAVLEISEPKIRVAHVPTINNLVICSLEKGEPRTVVANSEMTQYSWSPDSQFIAYIDKNRLYAYSLSDNKSRLLSPENIKVTGDPIWLPGGKKIFSWANGNAALYSVNSGEPDVFMLAIPYSVDQYILDAAGEFVYFKVADNKDGKQGLYKASLKNNKAQELFLGDWMIADLQYSDRYLLFTLQNATSPENIWILDPLTKAKKQISHLNKHASEYSLGNSELVSWQSSKGDLLKGVLLYPANYEQGRTYPVIIWVYETFSNDLHRFYLHLYNLQVLTNEGYGVFLPDVNFSEGDTTRSFVQAVDPALDRLLELKVANGNFGVMGHSFGGYATNALVTHTKRFKAAVAISGIADWISFHGLPADYMRLSNERGQGRMGGDLRDVPERYIKNSPIFYLNQVETPLMIIHGTNDFGVPFSQAEEMFYGLRRLKKTGILIGYPGEDHLYWGTHIRVLTDMWQRIIAWFDNYLK